MTAVNRPRVPAVRRYVLTGTPGAGKTSILRRLADAGYGVVEEAATAVIAREQARGDAEPWTRETFVEAVTALQRLRQEQAPADGGAQFYDRSPVCTHALSVHLGRPVPPSLSAEIERVGRARIYETEVFFVRNLGFCEPTAARRIGFEESLLFERVHERSYRAFGHRLIEVPPGPLDERVALVAGAVAARADR